MTTAIFYEAEYKPNFPISKYFASNCGLDETRKNYDRSVHKRT